MSSLSGHVALVTGAASGIGRETALLCARRGASVAICDVNEDALRQTEAEARRDRAEVLARRVDVSDRGQMQAFADAVHQRFGAVDLLVNNAGVAVGGSFLDTPLEDWDWVVSINLMGMVHGCKLFVPAMVERRRGHVVNLSSLAGYLPNSTLSAYTATKFAVLGLSQALRIELRPHHVGVTAVCPGLINTAITRTSPLRGTSEAQRERLVRIYERRNYGPDRVARKMLDAVQRNRAIAPVTVESWVMWWVTRLSPALGRRVAEAVDSAAR